MTLTGLWRAVHILASVLLAGAAVFEILVPGAAARGAAREELARRLRLLCRTAVALALLSWAGWLALVTVGMSGLPPAQALTAQVLRTVMARTTFGHVWTLRCVLLVLLALLAWRPARARTSPASQWVGGLAAAALVASLAWTGHASASGWAHLVADAVHLLAATVWLGMLAPLWFMVREAARTAQPAWLDGAAAATRRFSAAGSIAVALLAATGVLNACWLLDSPRDLLATRYGLLLSAKIALFAAMVALAMVNRFVLTPRIATPPAERDRLRAFAQLRRNIVAEALLGTAVIAIVAVLGTTAPAPHDRLRGGGPATHEMSM